MLALEKDIKITKTIVIFLLRNCSHTYTFALKRHLFPTYYRI